MRCNYTGLLVYLLVHFHFGMLTRNLSLLLISKSSEGKLNAKLYQYLKRVNINTIC